MNPMTWWPALAGVAILGGAAWLAIGQARLSRRLDEAERRLQALAEVSLHFPEFLAKGETITRTIADELAVRQGAIGTMIRQAEEHVRRLQFLEEKVQERKLDRESLNQALILINQGFTPQEISARLNIPLGEIDLMVRLKKVLRHPLAEGRA